MIGDEDRPRGDGLDGALRRILGRLQEGEISAEEALREIDAGSIARLAAGGLDFARLDLDRLARTGVPEIVYGEGKTLDEVCAIAEALVESTGRVLVTRIEADVGRALEMRLAGGSWVPRARLYRFGGLRATAGDRGRDRGTVSVVAAGTSDLAIAEEAALSLEWLGVEVGRVYDVGVAALRRVLAELDTLRAATVVVVVAGMDGALPSVVSGLVSAPVVAVPTSVGYGAAFEGLSALLAMLNSCSPGVTVVNIDNGLGAAVAAHRILGRM